jgi:hypothetical protein
VWQPKQQGATLLGMPVTAAGTLACSLASMAAAALLW